MNMLLRIHMYVDKSGETAESSVNTDAKTIQALDMHCVWFYTLQPLTTVCCFEINSSDWNHPVCC